MQKPRSTYPIDSVLPQLLSALETTANMVLSAPPGAGKTTRVPPALLAVPWLNGKKIIMLEPRRMAARRAAEFMAAQMDERPGQTIGYRIRGEAVVGKHTRIEVVTEGILTRLLQHDPELPEAGLIIFDEFHERSMHADLGLALTLDMQNHLRGDLKILVMSATLDGAAVKELLGTAALMESGGQSFPVETRYASFSSDKSPEIRIADAIVRALKEEEGDVLAFLPGRREIRRVENLLWERKLPQEVLVHTLYGDAPPRQQIAALSPAPVNTRKVILSTSIAETSLTIDGVRIIVDSGLARAARFDPRKGMSGLVTVPVSKAVADQRRGRAGRQQPGVCFRLWTESEHDSLPEFPQPEIKTADLAPLALDFALWGNPDGAGLRFLDPPPPGHLQHAQSLLRDLGALDDQKKLTPHGRSMAGLPLHPRLSHMVLRGNELALGPLACDIAALLEERDPLAGRKDSDIDLASRLSSVFEGGNGEEGIRERIHQQSKRLKQLTGAAGGKTPNGDASGILLALAYPDRIARRRDAAGNRYQMSGGMIATLPGGSLLAREEFLSLGDVDGLGAEVRVFLAAPLKKEDLMNVFAGTIKEEEEIRWNPENDAVVARTISRLGAMIIAEQHIEPHGEKVLAALMDGIRQLGVRVLPWDQESRSLRQRSEWFRKFHEHAAWPDLSDSSLLDTAEEWLAPHLAHIWRRDQLSKLPLAAILRSRFTYLQWAELDRFAPSHLKMPSGSRLAISYEAGDQPVLAAKLQELFGQTETPRIANGEVGVLLHVLSPASRPLAVTQDLRSFWQKVYPEIRTQMRARYPRHLWPENPLTAKPTGRPIRKKK